MGFILNLVMADCNLSSKQVVRQEWKLNTVLVLGETIKLETFVWRAIAPIIRKDQHS